jgi:hypothetical protein
LNPILPLAAALLALGAIPASAQVGETFSTWRADCRSDGYCAATTELTGNTLRIGRHAEEVWWEVSLTTSPAANLAAPVEVTVDGAAHTFAGPAQVGAYGAPSEIFFLGATIQSVMDLLPPATTIAVRFTGSDGSDRLVEYPLGGLNAALIWIDERQARLGSERVAEAPPVGLEPIGASAGGDIPVADLPPDLVEQHEARPDACDPFDMLGADAQFYNLGDGVTLYLVPCTGGAYQTFYSAYVAGKYGYELQTFAEVEYDGGIVTTDGVWQAGFDPASLTLESYNLGRSAGDCGLSGTYVWESGRFVLVRATAKPDCDAAGEPGQFPVIYERPAKPAN